MHDIDRTQLESDFESGMFEDEFGHSHEVHSHEVHAHEMGDTEAECPFDEAEEMALAAELLEITDEDELDQFLGKLMKKAAKAVGGIMRSPLGKSLGGILKGVAKRALPLAGTALGGVVGGPLGASLGSQLASTAGKAFGLEAEGMNAEDEQFEVARRFVRFAGAASGKAASTPSAAAPPAAARSAAMAAARSHAPGLLPGRSTGGGQPGPRGGRTGRWIRRGRQIVVLNC
jgi:uncharacterized protein (DUF697 family)